MISRLRIRGFQAHRDLDLRLSPGATTIVGPTDAGKSAVLRALRWAALNLPAGDAHVRRGSRRADVLLVADGRRVRRIRGRGQNCYRVDGKVLKAFGAAPPAEVSRLLRVGPANFQGQHEAPFWLSKSAGEVSRELNAVVDLGVIDQTMKKLEGAARAAAAEGRVVGERREEARAELRRLRPIRRAAAALADLRALQGAAEGAREKERALRARLRGAQDVAGAAARPVPPLRGLIRAEREASKARERAEAAAHAARGTRQAAERAERAGAEAEKAEQEFRRARGRACPLCERPYEEAK